MLVTRPICPITDRINKRAGKKYQGMKRSTRLSSEYDYFNFKFIVFSKWTSDERENACDKDSPKSDIAPHSETN